MGLVFGCKGALEDRKELRSRQARLIFKEEDLGRGTSLLVKLPDIARNTNAPSLLRGRVVPSARVHRGDGHSGTEGGDSRPMRKGQRANAENGFLAAPNHCAIDGLSHGFMEILAAALECGGENA